MVNRTVSRGQSVILNGITRDPDGDRLTSTWWQYSDADTYPGTVALPQTSQARHHIELPRAPGRAARPDDSPDPADNGTTARQRSRRTNVWCSQ
ncbi:hypothetical protein ACGFNP_01935 [Nonomuraea sp. NPDC049269]|uniref:hypothetical protein n=1 Tax=Nonomuraea sp. NPDC049269 TaxID=3364349 RepID=UPI00371BD8D5